MGKYRTHIAFIAFLLFSFMQIAELHALDHDDSSHDHCVLCDFSAEKSDPVYLLPSFSIVPEFTAITTTVHVVLYIPQHYFLNTTIKLRNKAPPVV